MASLEHNQSVVPLKVKHEDAETGFDKKPIWIYIDNSNIWRGAKEFAAKEACMKTVEDPRIRINMEKLIDLITCNQSRPVAKGVLFWSGKFPPPVDVSSLLGNWEKKMQSATEVNEDIRLKAYLTPPQIQSTIVVVSGDSRFLDGIKKALEMGWKIEIYSWSKALANCLRDLHVADSVMVNYLDTYLSEITFISREFNSSSTTISLYTKAAVLRMETDTFSASPNSLGAEFLDKLEKVSQWPFLYFWHNKSDLVLVFLNAECFDVDVFLEQVIKDPPAGVEYVKYYNAPSCSFKFCCKYGTKCFCEHTDDEMEFFRSNGGVGKPLRKIIACQHYDKGCCLNSKIDCRYAHGKEDATCLNCSQTGHFQEDCPAELKCFQVRCQGKFCCQYGTDCKKQHTFEEIEFFKSNGNVGKPYRKVKLCQFFEDDDKCYNHKEDCDYAHGEEDAVCPNCGMNGHFEINCSYVQQNGGFMPSPDDVMNSLGESITMNITNISTRGYPGTGKTSVLNLAMGKDADLTRNSTDCVDPPFRYTMTDSEEGVEWEDVTPEKMFQMICNAMKKTIEENPRPVGEPKHNENRITKQPMLLSNDTAAEPAIVSKEQVTSPVSTSSTNHMSSQSDPPSSDSSYFSKLYKELHSSRRPGVVFNSHWTMVTDCGGQPPFLDAAALFLRNNCLQIFPVKLNECLNLTPEFSYYINDIPATFDDCCLRFTTKQTIETLAKCVASMQPPCVEDSEPEGPKFTIIGTFEDKADDCSETIEDKEIALQEVLEQYFPFQVMHDDDKMMLPINAVTTDINKRRQLTKKLRQLIQKSGVTMKKVVKLRWFVFFLSLLTEAEKNGKDILTLDECFALAVKLGMEAEETENAIRFFDGISLIMHFNTPSLKNFIIVNTSLVLNMLSKFISASFLKNSFLASHCKIPLTDQEKKLLQYHGRFTKCTLEKCIGFSKSITLPLFLDILEHVKVVAAINETSEYFMPCALPVYPDYNWSDSDLSSIWAIRLKPRKGVSRDYVPIPVGFLPALVVFLLTEFSPYYSLPTIDRYRRNGLYRQYRNVITFKYEHGGTVRLVECHFQLEVHFLDCGNENLSMERTAIRNHFIESMRLAAEKLSIGVDLVDSFPCSCSNEIHFCDYKPERNFFECEKMTGLVIKELNFPLLWLGKVHVSTSVTDTIPVVPHDMHYDEDNDLQHGNRIRKFIDPSTYWNLYDCEYKGDNTTLMVFDTGIDMDHPSFKNRDKEGMLLLPQRDKMLLSSCDDMNKNGHGTLCAGIACGSEQTGTYKNSKRRFKCRGVAPNAKLGIWKAYDKNERTEWIEQLGLLTAYICEHEQPPIDVLVIVSGHKLPDDMMHRYIKTLDGKGIIIVCSGSNEGAKGNSIAYPAGFDQTICIGSNKQRCKPSDFSPEGEEMDFLAIGEDIIGPRSNGCEVKSADFLSDDSNEKFVICNGTSFSAPAVGGLICLILQTLKSNQKILRIAEDLNREFIEKLLKRLTNKKGRSRNETYGYGAIDSTRLQQFFNDPEHFIKQMRYDFEIMPPASAEALH